MGEFDGTYYGVGDVDFSGLYSSVTYQASWKHLEGTWDVTVGNVTAGTVDFVKDYQNGRYEIRSDGVPVRELQFSSDGSATSPDYVWSAHTWSGHTVFTDPRAPYSENMEGMWTVGGAQHRVRFSLTLYLVDPRIEDVTLAGDWNIYDNATNTFQRVEPVSTSGSQWQYENSFNGGLGIFTMGVSNMQTTYQASGQIDDTTFTVTITKPDGTTFGGTWSSNTNRIVFGPTYWEPANFAVAPSGIMTVTSINDEGTATVQYTHRLSLIHISEPTRPERISYAVICL
mgnify:CR=1 FL=1